MLKVQGKNDEMQGQFWMNAVRREKQANNQPPPPLTET